MNFDCCFYLYKLIYSLSGNQFQLFFIRKWLDSNTKTAKERTESLQIVRDDLKKLEKRLKSNLQLNDIQYDCAWNVEHIRSCLKSLDHLNKMHTNELKCLQGAF